MARGACCCRRWCRRLAHAADRRATLPSSSSPRAMRSAASRSLAAPAAQCRAALHALKRWLELLLRAAAALRRRVGGARRLGGRAGGAARRRPGWPPRCGPRGAAACYDARDRARPTTVPDGFLDVLTAADRDDARARGYAQPAARRYGMAGRHRRPPPSSSRRTCHPTTARRRREGWAAVEVALPRRRAGRAAGAQPCMPLSAMMTEQVPRAFVLARRLLERRRRTRLGGRCCAPRHLRVSVRVVARQARPVWAAAARALRRGAGRLPMLIYSLSVAEATPTRAARGARSKQAPAGRPLEDVPSPRRRRRRAARRCAAARARRAPRRRRRAAAADLAFRLPPPRRRLAARARGSLAPTRPPRWRRSSRRRSSRRRSGGSARRRRRRRARLLDALAELVSSSQRAAQPARAHRGRPRCRRRLIARACVLPPPAAAAAGVGAAACAALAALFDGCGAAARRCSPPSCRAATASRRRCLGRSPPRRRRRPRRGRRRRRPPRRLRRNAQLGALVAHVGGALATAGRATRGARCAAALWAEWFELYAEVAAARRTTEAREDAFDGRRAAAQSTPRQTAAAARRRRRRRRGVGGGRRAMPSLLGRVWAALRSSPRRTLRRRRRRHRQDCARDARSAQADAATPAGATVREPLGEHFAARSTRRRPRRRRRRRSAGG